MNLPNTLSVVRMCMIPLFIVAYFLSPVWAVVVFVLAAFTDFLDGYIARKYNMVTDLGKLLDPMADKVLVTAALFCVVGTNPLQYGMDGNASSIFLICCATVIIARELLISAVRMIAASKGIVVQANVYGKNQNDFSGRKFASFGFLQNRGKICPYIHGKLVAIGRKIHLHCCKRFVCRCDIAHDCFRCDLPRAKQKSVF